MDIKIAVVVVAMLSIFAFAQVSSLSADASTTLDEGLSFEKNWSKKFIQSEIDLTPEVKIRSGTQWNTSNVRAHLSNGKFAEIKIMPETASEIAITRLGLKVCSEENNCTIVLKETGNRNETRAFYEVNVTKKVKLFWIFKKNMMVSSKVDAETGSIMNIHEPWWAVITTEIKARDS